MDAGGVGVGVEWMWRLKLVSPHCECELASAGTLKRKNESLQTGGNSPLVRAAARPNLTGGAAKCKAADGPPFVPSLVRGIPIRVRHGTSP